MVVVVVVPSVEFSVETVVDEVVLSLLVVVLVVVVDARHRGHCAHAITLSHANPQPKKFATSKQSL